MYLRLRFRQIIKECNIMKIEGMTNVKLIQTYVDIPVMKSATENLNQILKKGERCPILEEKIFFDVKMHLSLKELISLKYVRNSLLRMMSNQFNVQRMDDPNDDDLCIVSVSIADAIEVIYQLTQPIMRKEIPSVITSVQNVINEFIRLTLPSDEEYDTTGMDKETEFDAVEFGKSVLQENIVKCLNIGLHTNFIDSLPSLNNEKENNSELMSALISEHPDCILAETISSGVSRLLIPCEIIEDEQDTQTSRDLYKFLAHPLVNIIDIHLFEHNADYRAYQIDVWHLPDNNFISATYEKTLEFAKSKL